MNKRTRWGGALALLLCLLLAGCGTREPTPETQKEPVAEPPAVSAARSTEETEPPAPAESAPAETEPAPSEEAEPVPMEESEPVPAEEEAPAEAEPEPVPAEPTPDEPEPEPEAEPAPEDESWKLILVNAEHPIPEGYSFTTTELRNGHRVDERIYPELQQMFDDARAVGIWPFVNESTRTAEEQQAIMDEYVARYEASGLSRKEAEAQAREIVAVPGTSEHQIGLALDIIAEFSSDSWSTWQWLKDNCARYGFILRYPADKTEITGIGYEPWHFRYVGVEAAEEIMDAGLCLEEYLGAGPVGEG